MRLPEHIAVIMDGNGRWAQKRGLPRIAGHKAGVESVRRIVENVGKLGIPYLTLYTFSTENWKRPQEEINGLMNLLLESLQRELDRLDRNGIRLRFIGWKDELPEHVQQAVALAQERTQNNDRLTVQIALNYGGRREIVEACRSIARQVAENQLSADSIDEALFERHLSTFPAPDPDLLIRPSGEMRISNFLLWQIAYCELWVTETLWPDFGQEDLMQAIEAFQKRDRRFGGLSGDC